ncbi:MAG: hypothetical protein PHC64_11455 [Candidatus Gastranaerophilales bacterium]|nr:hypothetical protein [Candidatus Gastranaerophilales bacterium]
MKKLFLILTVFTLISSAGYAQDTIALLTQKGFFERPQQSYGINSYEGIKRILYTHLKYANDYNFDGLRNLYSDNYTNADGFNKDIYFDLIKKTWEIYPGIRYKMDIKNITINSNSAVAQVIESAVATTQSKSGVVDKSGLLESISNSVYYFENINGDWLITSDYIISEKTLLRYGSAKDIEIELDAPFQVPADKDYTASFKIQSPKDSLVIASIGRENITYPQTIAEEVFRKIKEDGVLERVFKSNNKNINEYAVASFGITKAEIKNSSEIKISVTGLGFIMSRVNVIPKNGFIKVKDEKDEKNN